MSDPDSEELGLDASAMPPDLVAEFFEEATPKLTDPSPADPTAVEVETHESHNSEPTDSRANQLPFILEAISSLDHAIQSRFDRLQSVFEREVRAESTREKVVDRLHEELQEYKGDLLLKTMKPVFIDLIQLHDDIGKLVAAHTADAGAPLDAARLLEFIRGFQQGIEDILYRQGVEPYECEGDEPFDPRRQRAFSTVPNDDPALAKKVAARLRKGFQSGQKVIRPEIVSVFSTPKPSNPSNNQDVTLD